MYATQRDFERAFGQAELADLLSQGADYDTAESAAASLVNGYVGAKYTLPLASTPEVVRGWALDITRYRLWEERAPEEVRRRYEDALQQLRDLAAGRMALPPDASGAVAAGSFVSDGYSNERVFTASSLEDF